MKIQLPKSCISCTNYTPKGKKADELTPFKEAILYHGTDKVQFGHCQRHCKDVFCTEIFERYNQDGLVDVFDVANREKPMNPHQEQLF